MSTSDTLPADIERLRDDGTNWFVYEMRFKLAMRAKGKWGHFTGLVARPLDAQPLVVVAGWTAAEVNAAQAAQLILEQETEASQLAWDRNEDTADFMLAQRISDSLLGRISRYAHVADKWAAMEVEFTHKTMYQASAMRQDFLAHRCAKDGSVREFMDSLESEKERLAMSGIIITDVEYRTTIVNGLPSQIRNFACTQIENARTFASERNRVQIKDRHVDQSNAQLQ